MLVWLAEALGGSLHPPSLTVQAHPLFGSGVLLAGHSCVWKPICSQLGFRGPSRGGRPGSATPFPPAGPGLSLPPPLQSGLQRREEARFRPRCPHVLSPPPPPALRRAAKPVPLPDCDRRLPRLPALPVPAPPAPPLPLPEPGAGALEARPGPAALAPGGESAESCPSLWAREAVATTAQDVQASHLPPRPPPICSAG